MSQYDRYITPALVVAFGLLRILSYLLHANNRALEIIGGILVISFSIIAFKNYKTAWYILIAEFLIDGAGHYFEFGSLLLRTWFIGICALAWIREKISSPQNLFPALPKYIYGALAIFTFFLATAIARGFYFGNAAQLIIQDAILYCFVFLLLPAIEIPAMPRESFLKIIRALIFGSAIFSTVTFVLYSVGIFILRNDYYHWFRNVASGKITDLGFNFYRIVLSEHLFIVPIILVLLSVLIKNIRDKKTWLLLAPSLLIMSFNFTRIYILALCVGALFLLFKASFKNWLRASIGVIALAACIFFGSHTTASGGKSIGLELLGLRAYGISAPEKDLSSAIRLALLPDIKATIERHPLLGSGLGTTVSHVNPLTKERETRTQFDWGYFEMIAELGIIGSVAYIGFLSSILFTFAQKTNLLDPESYVARGFFAGAIALFIINITTPALFQGFGVLYFVLLLVIAQNKNRTI